MICLRTSSPDDTRAVGAALARVTRAGDVVLLAGELGSGKTVVAQGFVAGLGSDEVVTSPTFTLVRTYRGGRLVVHHADLYRLDRVGEVVDLALGELLDDEDDAVLLVEWGDVVPGLFGTEQLLVALEPGEPDDPDRRRVQLTARGSSWAARWDALRHALTGWVEPC